MWVHAVGWVLLFALIAIPLGLVLQDHPDPPKR